MTHTSTEQPEALRKLARYNDDHLTREEMDVLRDAALEIGLLRDRVQELEESLQDALSQMENDWERIDGEWGPCGLTLEQAVENGKHGTKAIKSARKALRHGITQEKQG